MISSFVVGKELHVDLDRRALHDPRQSIGPRIRYDKNGKVLKTLATFSNLDHTSGYLQKTFDVSGYAGQDVQIFFKAVEDQGKVSSFWLDDVTLTVQ